MFSQSATFRESARNWLGAAYYYGTALLTKEMQGDLPEILDNAYSEYNEQGVVLRRIGPRYLGLNVAKVSLLADEAIAEKQLKAIMTLAEPCARDPYKAFNTLADCEFILADNSNNALIQHKDFARYIKPSIIIAECKAQIPDFLAIYTKAAPSRSHVIFAEKFIRGIYFKAILGVESTPELIEIFSKVDELLNAAQMIIPLMVPNFLQKYLRFIDNPAIQTYLQKQIQTQKAINEACIGFMKLRAHAIINLFHNNVENILTKYLKLICPDKKDWSQLSDDECEYIANHKMMRNVIISMFPIINAAYVSAQAVSFALGSMHTDKIQKLATELQTHPEINIFDLKPPFSTTLEALYMMGLRLSKFEKVFRYTKKGIDIPGLQIPPHSLIICELTAWASNMELGKLFVGRGIYFISYDSDALPSIEILRDMMSSLSNENPILPLVMNSKNHLYVYGQTSAGTWRITSLGKSQDYMDNFNGSLYTKVIDMDDWQVDKKLITRIVELKAHLPFDEPETIKFKVGSSRHAFFGTGPRACPAAATVGRLTKELLTAALREFKGYERELSNKALKVAIPYIPPCARIEENSQESAMISGRVGSRP